MLDNGGLALPVALVLLCGLCRQPGVTAVAAWLLCELFGLLALPCGKLRGWKRGLLAAAVVVPIAAALFLLRALLDAPLPVPAFS